MLRIDHLRCGYGEMEAVHGLSLHLPKGGMTALIGANGAGKSSTLMCIAGHVPVQGGSLRFLGEEIASLSPMARVRKGIAIVPEGRRLFASLSVRENLIVGGYIRPKAASDQRMERVLTLFPRLRDRLDQTAGSLSGGEQQMLAIGRALMADPALLMVDELSLGLMPKMVDLCYQALADLKAEGLTILLVEQNTHRALSVADAICVMESGNVVWQGDAETARSDTALMDAYLGLSRRSVSA